MNNVYLDGTLSIARVDFPEIVQLTSWKGKDQDLSKWVNTGIGLALPAATKTSSNEDISILSSGPNKWLISGEGAVNLLSSFDEALGTSVDLSSARTLFQLRGDNLTWLLNKGTAVNFDVDVTPDGSVVMTTIDHVGVLIHKIAEDAFDLYAFSSFGDTMEHWLSVSSNDMAFE